MIYEYTEQENRMFEEAKKQTALLELLLISIRDIRPMMDFEREKIKKIKE